MNTNRKHQVTSVAMLMLALGIGPLALSATAWSSLITVDSVVPAPTSATYNLTTLGPVDWALPGNSEKAGGGAIVTYVSTNGKPDGHLRASYQTYGDWMVNPRFSYTNGELASTNPSTAWTTNPYEYTSDAGGYSAVINLPANISGTITVWCATWSKDDLAVPGTLTATFGDLTSAMTPLPGNGSAQMVTLSYSTAIAQALTLTVTDTGNTGNAGYYGLAVAPEPASALLLASGLMTLVSRNWRKRNQRTGLKWGFPARRE